MRFKNPLLDWNEVQHIVDWKYWLKLWNEVGLTEFRHSLLHFGFATPCDNYQEPLDRIRFYLTVADGHAKSKYMERPDEKQAGIPLESAFNSYRTTLGYVRHPSELRQKIARKAFEVLCPNFFHDRRDTNDTRSPVWTEEVLQKKVLPTLLWFLRVEGEHLINGVTWTRSDHQMKIFVDFAFKFCRFAWKYLDTRRPQLVQILAALGKTYVLLDEDAYPMNKPALLMLKKLAMSHELHIPSGRGKSDYRKPQDLIEAVAGQSQAARVFDTLLSIDWVKRRARRDEIARKKMELQDQLTRLGS